MLDSIPHAKLDSILDSADACVTARTVLSNKPVSQPESVLVVIL